MQDYSPEASAKPFHDRLIGRDRLELYSFVHSINTSFGTSIFEPLAALIAELNGWETAKQRTAGKTISSDAQAVITDIMNELVSGQNEPDASGEIERIREASHSGRDVTKKMRKIDVWLTSGSTVVLVEMKTVKPNLDGFEKIKQNLLEWTAAELYKEPTIDVVPIAGLPYNPYEPEPYKRWTFKGLFDLENENQLLVGPELWNFFAGGDEIYDVLLDCFQRVGEQLRPEIDDYFSRFTK